MKKILICLTISACFLQQSLAFAEKINLKTALEIARNTTYEGEYISRLNFIAELLNSDRTNVSFSETWLSSYFEDTPSMAPGEDFYKGNDDIEQLRSNFHTLNKAKKIGIINGYTDGTFKPFEPITREDMYLIMYQYLTSGIMKVKDGKEIKEPNLQILDKYKDKDKVSPWTAEAISALIDMNVYKTYDDNMLKPKEYVDPIEALVIIDDFYKNYFEEYIF